jgi:Ser/Thr protein kinase RdoA (MazF antagonist)
VTPEQAALAFGLDPDTLAPVASAYRDAAAYRAGSVLLKPWRYGERQLHLMTGALRHMQRQGFSLAPRLVLARGGRPFAGDPRQRWYAVTWIEGRRPRFPAELPEAAKSLAAFHGAARGFAVTWQPARSWRRRWASLLTDLLAFRRRAEAGSTPFDRAFAAAAPAFLKQAEACLEALETCGYDGLEAASRRTGGFCHRDVTAANLVTDGRGRVCLVDPDTWGPDLRLYDLTQLLTTGAACDPGRAIKAIRTYEAEAGQLSPAERALLPWNYLLPREFWWAGHCRYRRPSAGVEPGKALHNALTGAPARDACAKGLFAALGA